MAIASGSRARIATLAESTRGTTPGSGTWALRRLTSLNINLEKNVLESAEIRSTRQRADVRHGFNRVTGSLGFQLSHLDFDEFLEKLLGSTYATSVTTGSTSLASSTSPNAFTRASGSFVTEGFRPGDIVVASGFATAANNAEFTVSAVSATTLTVIETITVADSSASSRTIALVGGRLSVGTTLSTFSMERGFTDIAQYQVYRGCSINEMSLSIQPEQMVTGSFGILGMSAAAVSGSSIAGSPTAASTNEVFAAFDGALFEGGASIATCTAVDLSVNNNRSVEGVIGSKFTPDIFEGTCVVTGTATFFFENATLLNKFVNETESSLYIKLANPDGTQWLNVAMPRVKYTGGAIDPPANGPVKVTMPFQALEPALGSTIQFQRSANS